MKRYIAVLFLIFGCFVKAQQEQNLGEVKGLVSAEGDALPFVNIYAQGTTIGTVSDENGSFSLLVPLGEHTIVANFMGYGNVAKKVTVGRDPVVLNIEMYPDAFGLDQVVVSATKNEINRREAPVLVTVTNAETLEHVQAATLIDGLNFQPGLRTETNCQNCGFSQIRINGLEGAYSQILVNSKPVFGSLNGIYGLEQIPANMIRRIEVTRGGGSAIFGANAIAGTINIITKDPLENQFAASSRLGLINGKEADAQVHFNSSHVSDERNMGISFFGMYRNRNGYDHNADGFTEIAALKNLNVGFKSFYSINDRKKFTLEFNASSEYRRGGDNINQSPLQALIAEQIDTKVVGSGLTYDLFTPNYYNKFSFYGTVQGTRSDNYYGTNMDPSGFGLTEDFTFVSGIQHTAKFDQFLKGSMELTSGLEYRRNDISELRENPLVAPVDQDINTLGIFTQVDWKINEKLKFLSGVRGEFFESNLETSNLFILNPRVSLLYNITDKWSLRTSYAQGFRAPQFFSEDVHSEVITGEVRDIKLAANLKAERSQSFMGSLEYIFQKDTRQLLLTLEGFYTRINDPFVYEDRDIDANGLAFKEKINGKAVTVNGFNLEAKYSPNSTLSIQVGTTLQNSYFSEYYEPEDGIITNRLLRTPQIYGNGIVSYSPNKFWNVNLTGVYTGTMFVPHLAGFISATVLEETPGLFDAGINVSRTFSIGSDFQMQIQGGIKNLWNAYQDDFDKTVNRDPNYIYGPSQPQTFFVGLTIGNDLF